MNKITANIFKLTFRTLSLLFILQFLTICLGTERVFAEDLSAFSKVIKNSTTLGINIRLRDEYWNTFQKRGPDTESQTQASDQSKHAVQNMEIIVDSYSFQPDHITVSADIPVEITLRSVTSLISHNFSINDPSSGLDVDVDVPSGKDVTVSFTPIKTGKFRFYCNKKDIFGSHLKKGMEGTIEVMKYKQWLLLNLSEKTPSGT